MDTSETYVKMCEQAKEIQEIKPKDNTWDIKSFWAPAIPNIWLPRQDQLQEMIKDKFRLKTGEIFLIQPFYYFSLSQFYQKVNASMEQLWLAFVMKEKYGKLWNGQNWVKEGK